MWNLEILLSTRISQLSLSIKGGDGMQCVLLPLCMACVRLPAICYSGVEFPAAQPCPGFLSFCQVLCSLGKQQIVEHQCIYFYVVTTFPGGTLTMISAGLTTLSKSFIRSSWEKKSLRFLQSTLMVRLLPLTNPVNSSLHLHTPGSLCCCD